MGAAVGARRRRGPAAVKPRRLGADDLRRTAPERLERMAQSTFFEWLCDALERTTALDRLEARGTARLAIKTAGYEVRRITREQLYVVVRRVLGDELRARSVPDPEGVCEQLAQGIQRLAPAPDPGPEAPETVFRRLGART